VTTGWPPGLLQDDERKLSRWLASRPDAIYQLRKNMTQEDIIRMARESGPLISTPFDVWCERFAALAQAAERNKLAAWMMAKGYATGHGDTMEGLLEELGGQAIIRMVRVAEERVKVEREACAKVADKWVEGPERNYSELIADEIRARGQA